VAADDDILARIHQLVDEEHQLGAHASGAPLDADHESRLEALEESLDQCWDLLRQRRARRDAGLDPDDAAARPTGVVEGYQQ